MALGPEHLVYITARPVVGAVPVPRRDVKAELQPCFARRLGKIARQVELPGISIAASIRTVVICRSRRPEAETIVVLHHGNPALHPRGLRRCQPLPHIGPRRRREKSRVLASVPPLLARVRVQPVVEKGIKLHLVPRQLPLRGRGCSGAGSLSGLGRACSTSRNSLWARLSENGKRAARKNKTNEKQFFMTSILCEIPHPAACRGREAVAKLIFFPEKSRHFAEKALHVFWKSPAGFREKRRSFFSGKPPRPPAGLHFYPK